MTELVVRYTSLPNLHPALVHFPIALLPAAVLFDLIASWGRTWARNWFGRVAPVLYGLAAVSAGLAFWAGEEAADSLPKLAVETQLELNRHSDSALYTLWVMGILAAARIGLEWWDMEGSRRIPRLLVLLAAAGGVGLLVRTADLGGSLVFQHGVAVRGVEYAEQGGAADRASTPDGSSAQGNGGSVASRFVTGPDGSLEWKPLATDGSALGTILKPAQGSDLNAVRAVDPEPGAAGLALAVEGDAMLLLPGIFGDVQVETELALDGFEGEAGVAHHVQNVARAGTFTLTVPANELVLGSVGPEGLDELDRATARVGSGPVQLAVSAIGRHLRGMIGSETVVHAHEPALPDGACGIIVQGTGSVRVLSVKVTPASE